MDVPWMDKYAIMIENIEVIETIMANEDIPDGEKLRKINVTLNRIRDTRDFWDEES